MTSLHVDAARPRSDEDQHRYPRRIGAVSVNGVVVVDSGQHTGTQPGRVLRRGPAGLA